jgi:adenine phosphoribosyltransferase
MPALSKRVAATLGTIQDFPKPGIVFKDIAPVLADPALLMDVCLWIQNENHSHSARAYSKEDLVDVDLVVALDARGFLFGVPVAQDLGVPFVMCRKAGKLPGPCSAVTYDLEYGTATCELQKGAIQPGQRVLLVDDLLATGGTALAAVQLIQEQGGIVTEAVFVTELDFLFGRKRLIEAGVPIRSLVHL